MEYAAAKSTMCRQCGGAFSPSIPKAEVQAAQQARAQHSAGPSLVEEGASLLRKFDGLWGKPRSSVVECFDCKAKTEVNSAAQSTNCPKCSAHLDLRDYKISTPFSRSIRTHGEVHVTSKGDLSSSSVTCRSALIEGKVRGNLTCVGTATINYSGKIPGRITADHLLIERKAEVQFFRRTKVKSIEIRGHMTGEVIADTVVVIHRNASLDGDVTAKAISVEKGGVFTGQLVIGSSGLKQAELLPTTSTSATNAAPAAPLAQAEDGMLPGIVPPLPAT
jgi:cytoskeletal protein CcmA (bactofilin family)